MDGLTELEQAVLDKLLAGGHPALVALRAQAKRSRLSHREYTGVGFRSDFAVPEEAPVTTPRDFLLDDVDATIPGLKHGAGFTMHVRRGHLSQLEGYTYDEPWPGEIAGFGLTYAEDPRQLRIVEVSAPSRGSDPSSSS